MIAVLDCDILSTFAKINKIGLLEGLFSKLLMPYAVYVELKRARSLGFDFPDLVFKSEIELVTLNTKEVRDFEVFTDTPKIHYGEAEGMSIAKNRNAVFLTNDRQVITLCEKENIMVLDLKDVLRQIARRKLVGREGMITILDEIERADNTLLKERDDVLKEYEN